MTSTVAPQAQSTNLEIIPGRLFSSASGNTTYVPPLHHRKISFLSVCITSAFLP